MVQVVKLTFKLQYSCTINLHSYPNIPMKANRKQNAVKLTSSKIGTHVMVQVATRNCLKNLAGVDLNPF